MIDWTVVINGAIGGLIGCTPAILIAWLTHRKVNGAMHEMMKDKADKAAAEATIAEKDAEQGRKDAKAEARKR